MLHKHQKHTKNLFFRSKNLFFVRLFQIHIFVHTNTKNTTKTSFFISENSLYACVFCRFIPLTHTNTKNTPRTWYLDLKIDLCVFFCSDSSVLHTHTKNTKNFIEKIKLHQRRWPEVCRSCHGRRKSVKLTIVDYMILFEHQKQVYS